MRLSLCIPAYNETGHLAACIGSVRASFEALGRNDFEIVVCDNNSTDGTGELAAALGARVVFEPHNQIARARNAAARAATGEWLIFLDADSRLSPELLGATLAAMKEPATCGGGARIEFDQPLQSWFVRFGLWSWTNISLLCNWAAGSYVFCLRQAWEETGGFGEEVYAGEEITFSRRLKRWAKQNGKQFRILRKGRLITSARKMEMFTERELFRMMWGLMSPGALRRRESCSLWYKR